MYKKNSTNKKNYKIMTKISKREHWIDISRLVAMTAIIICHTPCYEKKILSFLTVFVVTIFFILSGFLYHPQTFKAEIKKSFNSLIIPYIILGAINCIYYSMQNLLTKGIPFWDNLLSYSKILFTTQIGLPLIGPLWFLIVLFLLRITMVKSTHTYAVVFISIICIVGGYSIATYLPDSYFYAPLNYFLAMPFFATGILLQKNVQILKKTFLLHKIARVILFSLLIALSLIIFQYQGSNNMSMHNYGTNIITFYLCAILCSAGIFILSSQITIKSPDISKILHTANNGLPLMIGLQILMIDFFKRIIHIYAFHITGSFILSITIIITIYPLTLLSMRYFPIILGKRNYI